jgi:glycerophosphoryl diester phosphodiesterase
MPGSVHQLFKALLQAGVDGLFTDDPGLGVKARDLWMAEA